MAEPYKLVVFRSGGGTWIDIVREYGLEMARNSTWQISIHNVISGFLILILLFVPYSLISFSFLFIFWSGRGILGSIHGTQVGKH